MSGEGTSKVGLAAARAQVAKLAHLNAFISLTEETGAGPVIAVKDNIDVIGIATTAGARILHDAAPAQDASVVRRIRERGGVVIGKTNLHEFAYGGTSENPHFGNVLNPHDLRRVAGGSSGGSAVAVATGMCDWALGTDTGGSIRIPAAFCGVVGLKPTTGNLELDGVFPLSSTLDTVGPLAPTVREAAHAMEWISGKSNLVLKRPSSLASYRIATPQDWVEALDRDVSNVWHRIVRGLKVLNFPDRSRLARYGLVIMRAEAAAVHREWMTLYPDRYGDDVMALLNEGLTIGATDYVDAIRSIVSLRNDVEAAMNGVDALMLPTVPFVAPPVGATADIRPLIPQFTRPFNAAGSPVVSLPAPTEGLPVGIQLVGHYDREDSLLAVALAVEEEWRNLTSSQ